MSSFQWPPVGGGSGGIQTYANFAALPLTATDGAQAVTLDTDSIYIFNSGSGTWLLVGSTTTVTTLAAVGSSPNANAGVISGNTLTLEPADGTHPGVVTSGTQTIGGNKTFSGTLGASNLSGTNTGDVTIGTANGLSLSSQALSLATSSTSTTGALTATDWNTFNGKQASGNYITALTGDISASGPGSVAATLASVATAGTTGSSTSIPSVTINVKGLVTSVTGNAVIAPAGTLTGTTLASNVVTSSITTVGTIGAGTWQGTAVAAGFGGTGSSSVPTSGQIPVGNAGGTAYAPQSLSADATLASTGALTLATVNANTGSFGSSTAIPNFTVNGKGLITAAGTNVVIAPAGTLTGTTLAANVVTSSLTAVGTITSGTWTGTTIAVANGGTGQTTYTNGQLLIGNTSGNTLTKSTLTAGTGISITNNTGSITIANTGVATLKVPTIQRFTTGSGTYTTPTSPAPLYIIVEAVGGGGGGGSSGSSGAHDGTAGANTTFGASLTAGLGAAGLAGSNSSGGAGGTNTVSEGTVLVNVQGGSGGSVDGNTTAAPGGAGGNSVFGGSGGNGKTGTAPSGSANSGAGGGGANSGSVAISGGGGGGAGGYFKTLISSPSATYAYGVGAGGTGGSNTNSGGAGGSGVIIVTEYYQ